MKEKKKIFTRYEVVWLIIAAFFVVLLIVLLCLGQSTSGGGWWSRNVWRVYQRVSGTFSSIFVLSMMELYYAVIGICCITLFILAIYNAVKKRGKQLVSSITVMLTLVLSTCVMYYATAGLAYNRDEVEIPLYGERVNQDDYQSVIDYFIDDFNYCATQLEFDENGGVVCPYTWNELNDIYQKEFLRLDSDYFCSYTPRVKPMMTSFLFSELHITGVFFSITGDSNVNYMIPNSSLAFTFAHELAHSKGVMREDEANLVSMYINLTSDLPFLRYNAYFRGFNSLLSLANASTTTEPSVIYSNISYEIKNDFRYNSSFWTSHNLFADIGNWINDLYLKINGTSGTDSYIDTSGDQDTDNGGTDDEGKVVLDLSSYSPYQMLFFELYYN